ncbi:MAG: hypothetical protein AAF572_05895 [Cyanobacteria bacterium P01_B01_bin.77]
MIRGAEQILALARKDTQIIPGHDPLSTRAELGTYQQLRVEVKVLMESAIANGLSLENFLASNPTAKLRCHLGPGLFIPRTVSNHRLLKFSGIEP